MDEVDLANLLQGAGEHVVDELERMPDVEDKGHALDVDELPSDERLWHRVEDAIAVVADLKSSTHLGLKRMHVAPRASTRPRRET
ncbi:MAG: hypothetical protein M3332_11335 [Actinomycetota bacterium]|nr:hypothetical protein [Actinomycetota bacterium]